MATDSLEERAKAAHRAYNDIEEEQAQRYYGEHAREEWEELAPGDQERWRKMAEWIDAHTEAQLGALDQAGKEPLRFGVTCGCKLSPVHSTIDPVFHPEEARWAQDLKEGA